LLQAFPPSVTLLVFVAALLLAMVLFYRCFLLYSDTLLKNRAPILLPHTNEVVMASTGETVLVVAPDTESTSDEIVDDNLSGMNSCNRSLSSAEEEKLREYRVRYQLSARETEVLEQIMLNRSINEIGDALFISSRTVKFHITSLLRKTGASSQRSLKRELTGQD
jgi:DNA-binding CsgD family transcriptional regulator